MMPARSQKVRVYYRTLGTPDRYDSLNFSNIAIRRVSREENANNAFAALPLALPEHRVIHSAVLDSLTRLLFS
jgi:hypothetical protein